MNLYPPPNGEITFDHMQAAAIAAIEKDPSYPKKTFTGLDAIAFAVYTNRIFAFRFVKLFRKKGMLGGSISRLGIFIQYHDHSRAYTWEQITNLKITKTSYIGADSNTPQGQYNFYDIEMTFGDNSGLVFGTQQVRMKEFPKSPTHREWKHMGDLFALYYNRVRQEKIQLLLHKGNKQVLLHEPIDDRFAQEILRRFYSPEGIHLKYLRKRVSITKNGMVFLKGKKKITAEIQWNDFTHLIIGKGTVSPVILFIDSRNPAQYIQSFYPNNYNLKPKDKSLNKNQMMHIVPVCWMSL